MPLAGKLAEGEDPSGNRIASGRIKVKTRDLTIPQFPDLFHSWRSGLTRSMRRKQPLALVSRKSAIQGGGVTTAKVIREGWKGKKRKRGGGWPPFHYFFFNKGELAVIGRCGPGGWANIFGIQRFSGAAQHGFMWALHHLIYHRGVFRAAVKAFFKTVGIRITSRSARRRRACIHRQSCH